ncbi:hypothetical protein ABEB36_010762 [Hypothenemus hampei]|uniref:Tyr recombinase domain-containing protein n=1 Tax=Hypothenemus hampei TaxID=57062 RepID=A0ABD1EH99_HYPHA
MDGQRRKKIELKDLIQLIESHWCSEISSLALKTLNEKKIKNQVELRLTNDVLLFQSYVDEIAVKAYENLELETNVIKNYKILAECILAKTVMFNRKRIGDVQYLQIETYTKNNSSTNDNGFENSLTTVEKILAKKFKRVVTDGKHSKPIPILFPRKIQKFIEVLLKVRECFNIVPKSNPYLFANPNSNKSWMSGVHVMRRLAKECGAQKPHLLTSTRFRKHIATTLQLMDMMPNEIEQVATFMGHTKKTHEEFYRLPQDIFQTAKVAKVLLLLEKGRGHEFKGKSLTDIELQKDVYYSSEDENQETDEESVCEKEQVETVVESNDLHEKKEINSSSIKQPELEPNDISQVQDDFITETNQITKKEYKEPKLIDNHWCNEISSLALKTLNEKKIKKQVELPLTSDVLLFQSYLDEIAAKAYECLEMETNITKNYKTLTECVLAKTVMFNRKRIGDVQYLQVETYIKSNNSIDDQEFSNSLTTVEKILAKKCKRVVTDGKHSKPVPILFPRKIQKFLSLLLKVRDAFNIVPKSNPYLFANPNSCKSWMSGVHVMRRLAKESGAEKPHLLTSTRFRKHIATTLQLMDMLPNEIEQVATFMGHTKNFIDCPRIFTKQPKWLNYSLVKFVSSTSFVTSVDSQKKFKMGKTKENSSQKLEKRREAKKMSMRRARQKIRNDPIRYAEEKAKDRERKRKSRPHIQDLSERNQRKKFC